MSGPRTLYDKIWDAHVVEKPRGRHVPLYIDRHLVLEVTCPGLRGAPPSPAARCAGRLSPSPSPTTICRRRIDAPATPIRCRAAGRALERNVASSASRYFATTATARASCMSSARSRALRFPARRWFAATAIPRTHGAFGALAFGIGTSEVEHVLATQTLIAEALAQHGVTSTARFVRRLGQGRDPGPVRHHRHGGRDGLCHRVSRRPFADYHGMPHDGLEHVDRGGHHAPACSHRTTRPSTI